MNNYAFQDNAYKRRSLGATVLGGKARRSGESDRERWGVGEYNTLPLLCWRLLLFFFFPLSLLLTNQGMLAII